MSPRKLDEPPPPTVAIGFEITVPNPALPVSVRRYSPLESVANAAVVAKLLVSVPPPMPGAAKSI